MHGEARDFLNKIGERYPSVYRSQKVLELGSLDMNGSPREKFKGAKHYVGLDWRAGKGVDEVSLAHTYHGQPDNYFDCIVSTEMLEHDFYWKQTLERAIELLAPEGHMLLTMAGPGRRPHEQEVSPVAGHYENRKLIEILQVVLAKASFRAIMAEDNPNPGDLYFLFFNKKSEEAFHV